MQAPLIWEGKQYKSNILNTKKIMTAPPTQKPIIIEDLIRLLAMKMI